MAIERIYADVGNGQSVLLNNEIYGKIQKASFLAKIKYTSGLYSAELGDKLLQSIEQYKQQLPKDLTEVRDRIKSLNLTHKELTETELCVNHIVNTSNLFLRAVYKIASVIRSHFHPHRPVTIAKLNESIKNDICQAPSHGLLVGSTVIGGKTYKIHAMPELNSMKNEYVSAARIKAQVKVEEVSGTTLFSILDETNKPLCTLNVHHRYQAQDGSVVYEESKSDEKTYKRFLEVFSQGRNETYAIDQILTQMALEIFTRDAATRLVVVTGQYVSSVLLDAGFVSTGNAEAMKQIKEKLATKMSKQPAVEPDAQSLFQCPDKYISDFSFQMFKHSSASSVTNTRFYVKPEADTEVDVTVTGVWKTFLNSEKDLSTWEAIVTERPILSGTGPVIPDSWAFNK